MCIGPAVCGKSPTTGETYCVPSPDRLCTPNVLSMGVDWSGRVIAAGSTRQLLI